MRQKAGVVAKVESGIREQDFFFLMEDVKACWQIVGDEVAESDNLLAQDRTARPMPLSGQVQTGFSRQVQGPQISSVSVTTQSPGHGASLGHTVRSR